MPNNDSPVTPSEKSGDVWLGAVLVGLALVVFALSRSIKSLGLGDNFDPGSKAFPLGLAAILGVGGLVEIWHSHRASATTNPPKRDNRAKTAAILLAGLSVYVFMLPWLGFALSTLLMATAMMKWLGNTWPRALVAVVVLIGIVYALFVVGFKVPLPGGVLNLPF